MKIALLADTHFGVRGNADPFHDNMETFFMDVFFPYLKKNGINKIIHLGDVFDNRRTIDMKTAQRAREYFFEPLVNQGISMDVIAGNHDLYMKESSDISTLEEFISKSYRMIQFFTKTTEVGPFLYVPWINKQNRDATMHDIETTNKKIVLGHLELTGVNYSRVQVATHGDDPSIFEKFDHVYSGHYHYRNTLGNVTYLGSPTQHTWIDADTSRGFHVIDSETLKIEFIPNPFDIFEYVSYPYTGSVERNWRKHIRINVNDMGKKSEFDKFKRIIENALAYSVTVITPKSEAISNTDNSITHLSQEEIDDPITFMRAIVTDDDEYNTLVDLYNKANMI